MKNIYDESLESLQNYFKEHNVKAFRATQVFEWLYRKRVTDFSLMTNLSNQLIIDLKKDYSIDFLEKVECQVASDGTKKYLFKLKDNQLIETVLMRHNYGNSVCVTSEVGCNMGCSFCASGELKKIRNLTLGEMVGQVLYIQKDLDETLERITNVVVMGIGEPFDNYDVVLDFLRTINYPKGLEIGARHITVSTCGIVPKILEFANFDLQVNLAISLHASNNELRSSLMGINRAYPIEQLLSAVRSYIVKTNRRVTFEYILLKGVNDSKENALDLCRLLFGINCYVNLIPYNPVSTKPFEQSSHIASEQFYKILTDHKIQATLRSEHGNDIDAACGQLRANKLEEW